MHDAVKKQQLRYIRYNLVAFTIIFGLFGVIVYAQVAATLFSRVDNELRALHSMIESRPEFVSEQLSLFFSQKGGADNDGEVRVIIRGAERQLQEGNLAPPASMRVQVVVRDGGGEILNGEMLGSLFWGGALEEIPFMPEKADTITPFRIGKHSVFNSLLFMHEGTGGEPYWIQLIANIDGEIGMIENFLHILVFCVLSFIALSLVASYVLSRKSMEPLIRSWNRQSEFVENASHELRTPLTILQNKLEALLVTPKATVLEKADSIGVCLSETRRLAKLTSDLMTLARADSDQTQLDPEPFLLGELVAEVSEPYREMAELEEKQLLLDLNDAAPLMADKARIHELMIILLDNALKYTRPGDAITIHTDQREGRTALEVRDTGIGIGSEGEKRVFDRFYREDKARSREKGGSGLGLSIAKWIMDAHGGSIRVLANQPAGTILQVRIPK